MKSKPSRQIFGKLPNINYHKNPSGGRQVAPCGWSDGRTDMMKLTVALRNFVSTPEELFTILSIDLPVIPTKPYQNSSSHAAEVLFTPKPLRM